MCTRICAHDALMVAGKKAAIDHAKCVGCGRCIAMCPRDAIVCDYDESNDVLNCKIAEYTKAVVAGRPCFHISLVVDVSPNCDCHAENDVPIVPNVGMFASFDPVALDQACADAVNAMPVNPDSSIGKYTGDPCGCENRDRFRLSHPDTDWQIALAHGEKIGLGTREYKLIRI